MMQRSDELRDFVLLYYQAIASGDWGFLDRHMSREGEVLAIGAYPGEWWSGYASVIAAYGAGITEKSVGIPLVAGDPQAYREGSVGWVADRVQIRLPDGTEIPCRLTMVWHEENGCWKIVQHHLSVGAGREVTDRPPNRKRLCPTTRCSRSDHGALAPVVRTGYPDWRHAKRGP